MGRLIILAAVAALAATDVLSQPAAPRPTPEGRPTEQNRQSEVTTPAASPTASAAPAAPAPDADGSPRLAVARELIEHINRDGRFFTTSLTPMETSMRASAAATDAATLAQVNAYLTAYRAEAMANMADFNLSFARVFARTYTEEELRGLLAFARTPAGLRFFLTQAELGMDSMVTGQAFAQRMMPGVMRRVQAQGL